MLLLAEALLNKTLSVSAGDLVLSLRVNRLKVVLEMAVSVLVKWSEIGTCIRISRRCRAMAHARALDSIRAVWSATGLLSLCWRG